MKHHIDHEDQYSASDFGDDIDFDPADCKRKMEIKRKLDQQMEKRRLKQELEDYEGELDEEFDWDDYDDKS